MFQIAIFGHETWQLVKVPEVSHILSFLAMGRNWAYFHSTGFLESSHNWAWNLASGQCWRTCTYTLFLPQRCRNWAYFYSTCNGFWDAGHFSKLVYLGWNLAIGQARKMSNVLKSLRSVTKKLFWIDIGNEIYLERKYAACVQLLCLMIANVHCL